MNNLKQQLKRAGLRIKDIADATGFSRVTVHNVLIRRQFCQPVQDLVARSLGRSPKDLWGSDYFPTRKATKKAEK